MAINPNNSVTVSAEHEALMQGVRINLNFAEKQSEHLASSIKDLLMIAYCERLAVIKIE